MKYIRANTQFDLNYNIFVYGLFYCTNPMKQGKVSFIMTFIFILLYGNKNGIKC